jgi:hypothetical protein
MRLAGGVGQHGAVAAHDVGERDLRVRGDSADAHAAVGRADAAQLGDAADVDQRARCRQAQLQPPASSLAPGCAESSRWASATEVAR